MADLKFKLTNEDILQILEKLYNDCIKGIDYVSPSIQELADDYLNKTYDVKSAAKSFIKYQIGKCTISGVITGFGGLITLPISIPANIGSVLYIQMRMIACLAYMGGYDTKSDQVQTLVYACLAGVSLENIIKKAGIEVGQKIGHELVKKIPGSVIAKINQKVGFRLVSRTSTKGIITINKAVPVIGSVISGGLDFTETKIIADRAYKMFILGDFSDSDIKSDDNTIDINDFDIVDEDTNNPDTED